MKKINIFEAKVHDCFGCGVCAISCPKRIIDIRLNDRGFYVPYLNDAEVCIQCGICVDVCSWLDEKKAIESNPVQSYAAWSDNDVVLHRCSSGGVTFEIERQAIENGYKVIAVKYNIEEGRAEHYVISTVDELSPSIGSKYMQSFTLEGFSQIERNQKYLIVGTPCQIDGIRRYIRKYKIEDNFILVDFFCHGVPSMLSWNVYKKIQEKKVGSLTHVSWRNKQTGWHDNCPKGFAYKGSGETVDWHDSYNMLLRGEGTFLNSRLSQGDIFYKFFLGNFCLNSSCENHCKYKNNQSSADIRVGDMWGKTYKNNRDGVSALIIFTERGKDIVTDLNNTTLIEYPFEVVAEGQMKKNAKPAVLKKLVMNTLMNSSNPLILENKMFWNIIFKTERIITLPQSVFFRLKMLLHSL